MYQLMNILEQATDITLRKKSRIYKQFLLGMGILNENWNSETPERW